MYFLTLYLEFNYYIVLCSDLIVTLKRPFISGKKRMKYYHIFVVISSAFLLGFSISDIKKFCF